MEQTTETQKKEQIKSQATKIRTLLQMQKTIIGRQQKLAPFKQPCLILMRNNKKSEWYENATIGKFTYTHSNGEEMYITLDRHFLQTLDYAGNEIQLYICHEDYPFPMPHEPLITADLFKIVIEKILNDYRKWLAEEWRAKGDLWWKVLIGIAAIIIAYMLYKMFTGTTGNEPQEIQTVTQTIQQNATIFP